MAFQLPRVRRGRAHNVGPSALALSASTGCAECFRDGIGRACLAPVRGYRRHRRRYRQSIYADRGIQGVNIDATLQHWVSRPRIGRGICLPSVFLHSPCAGRK